MAGKNKVRLALLVVVVVGLMPAETFAGPMFSSPPEPGPVYPAPYYSPCHYWTQLIYRFSAKCYYGVCGHRYTLDYYPPGPSSESSISHPTPTGEQGTPSGEAKPPSGRSSEA